MKAGSLNLEMPVLCTCLFFADDGELNPVIEARRKPLQLVAPHLNMRTRTTKKVLVTYASSIKMLLVYTCGRCVPACPHVYLQQQLECAACSLVQQVTCGVHSQVKASDFSTRRGHAGPNTPPVCSSGIVSGGPASIWLDSYV